MEKRHVFVLAMLVIVLLGMSIVIISNKISLNGFTIYQNQPSSADGKDTYIRTGSASGAGTDIVLKVGKSASGLEYRSLIAFNISDIPAGSTILNSLIELYASTNNQQNLTIYAYMITTDWNETTATWDNNTASSQWSDSGADYDHSFLSAINITSASQWYNISITSAMRNWMNGSSSNYGIILIASSAGNNNLTQFVSSNDPGSNHPILWVDYTSNAPPSIINISTDSSTTSPKNVGQTLNFNVNWNDLESNPSQIFICNSSSIIFPSGCSEKTFCNTSLSQDNPASCSYVVQQSDNRTTSFWVAACDSSNCSLANQSAFYMNHFPNIKLISPNGGEIINQSQGNFSIKFNVSDSDSDSLTASLFYGETQNSTSYPIASNLPLSSYCTDKDSNTATANNCTYSWNTLGIYGSYFLTILVNDSYSASSNSSASSFDVKSIVDSQPPNITAEWIESGNIFSGKRIQVFANVSDPNLKFVWFSLNNSPLQSILMTNISFSTFNASFIAPAVGTYSFKVYANDTLGNLNDSMPWIEFNVTKPLAATQNELSPALALPYTIIKIKGELNSSDPLTDIYAYLNAPDGFTFLQDYQQNSYLGNFSPDTTKEIDWFISTPINQSEYSFNITYTDAFNNKWYSQNTYTNVTSSFAPPTSPIYSLSLTDYPHVAVSDNYYIEASFRQNGLPATPESIKLSLYDPLGNLVIGPIDMLLKQTGIYNYTYTVPLGQTAGQWQTIVNATKNSVDYYSNSFWKLIGALFDVRDINIINTDVDKLNISVITENKGNTPTDLTLIWNLTRNDNGQQLNSGANTFAVGSTPLTRYIHPSTEYIGQVKITFVGYYSKTEKAAAFAIFSTTPAQQNNQTNQTGGGAPSGGGGGAQIYKPNVTTSKNASFELIGLENDILIAKNIKQTVKVIVNNTGYIDLTNIYLIFSGIDQKYYTISPPSIMKIGSKEIAVFTVDFLVSDFTGEKDFTYLVKSDELQKEGNARINVLLPADYILKMLQILKDKSALFRSQTNDKDILAGLDKCDALAIDTENYVQNDQLLNAKDKLDETSNCLDNINKMIESKKNKLSINIGGYEISIVLLVLAIILLVVMIIVIYFFYKKFNILSFVRKGQRTKVLKSAKNEKFDEEIKKIEEELED